MNDEPFVVDSTLPAEFKNCTFDNFCKKCNTPMKPGVAIEQTVVGSLDMGEVCTLSPGGPGELRTCSYKCPACGWSVW